MEAVKKFAGEHGVAVVIIAGGFSLVSSLATSFFTAHATKETSMLENKTQIVDIITRQSTEFNKQLLLEISELKAENKLLDARVHELEAKTLQQDIIISQQFDRLEVISSYAEYLPHPAWLKDLDHTMQVINEQYSIQFAVSKWRFLGKKDHEVYSKEIAEKFIRNDKRVLDCLCAITTFEERPRFALKPAGENNPTKLWLVQRWPVLHNNELYGVAGQAFDPTDFNIPDEMLSEETIIYGYSVDDPDFFIQMPFETLQSLQKKRQKFFKRVVN